MLFNDSSYKRDTGKLLVTAGLVIMVFFSILLFAGTGTLTFNF